MSLKSFYASDAGHNILEETSFSAQISAFIEAEHRFVENLAEKVDYIVELGCSDGRYADSAVKRSKKYLGIDFIEKKIELAKAKALQLYGNKGNVEFLCLDGRQAYKVVDDYLNSCFLPHRKVLFLYSFNVFGNIYPEIDGLSMQLISYLRDRQFSFYIGLFKTNDFANKTREEYYKKCGCQALSRKTTDFGVTFYSACGLRTTAFEPIWLTSKFKDLGLKSTVHNLSKVGIGILGSC